MPDYVRLWFIGLVGLVCVWFVAGVDNTNATGDSCRQGTFNPTDYNKCLIMYDNE